MSTRHIHTPTARCRFGIAQRDITPPVGVYHPFWGAARHERATGVHRPLTASVLLFESVSGDTADSGPVVVALDHCLFRPAEMRQVLKATAELTGVDSERLVFAFSHTHSAGNFCLNRTALPGGEFIAAYLDELPQIVAHAYDEARQLLQPVTITYGDTICPMGHNRDFWDENAGRFVCGFNPDEETELLVKVLRVTGTNNEPVATLVNYPCHPTTLAWQNTLISPDYVGALRETMERATGVPCAFLLAPCGDIGPRYGFVGDTNVADANGRRVAYAALSVLEGMPPPGSDHHYAGPVVSGATLGAWEYRALGESARERAQQFRFRHWQKEWPLRDDLPTTDHVQRELKQFLTEEQQAHQSGDEQRAATAHAMAERRRRLLERIGHLPSDGNYGIDLWAWQLGDLIWLAVESEPYHWLQAELERRFPDVPLLVTTLANGANGSYLPEHDDYGKPLYQAEIAVLQAGCLEVVADALSKQVASWSASI